MKLSQCDIILKAMMNNEEKEEWSASDFQYGENFVGYEASARMSDLVRNNPYLFIVGRKGRFRTLKINWENKEEIKRIKDYLRTLE